MKKIFTLLAASLATVAVNAQSISISQADYASWTPRTDTFQDVDANLTLAANSTWDLSTAQYDPQIFTFTYSPFSNTGLAGATYSYPSGYGFSQFVYFTTIAGGISASGVSEYGEVVAAQKFDISQLTTRAGDSLIFPAQVVPYSTPRKRIAFPATAGSVWSTPFSYSTSFTLKYNGMPLPGVRKTYTTQTDSVQGWGRVRVKRLNGQTSAWINVLGTKTNTKTVDSLFLNGAAAPPQLLSGFGLTQGARDSFYAVQLFRKGEIEPLVIVGYDNPAYTNPDYASVHQSRIQSNVGVNDAAAAISMKLYPNPSTSVSGFDIELTETAPGAWSYNLLDATGKVVSSATIQPNGGKAHVNAAQTAPGNYFLNVQKNGQQVATAPVMIKN